MNNSNNVNFIITRLKGLSILTFLCFLLLIALTSFNAPIVESNKVNTIAESLFLRIPNMQGIKKVVIDAGHGGGDSGCLGSKAKEKDVALSVALKLGKLIEDNCKNVQVIYTRKTDVFIELHRRAEIANENKADLFICIHCNSGPKTAYGTESWVMGLHKTEDNLVVAKRENESILMESNYEGHYDGFDPKSPEANIIFSLYQNAYMDQSLDFASLIQAQVHDNLKRYDRGIKQAGFLVLYKTTMPSVLVETGFLTNENEQKYLTSVDGQNHIASAIFEAFKNYKTKMEGGVVANVTSIPINASNNDDSTIEQTKEEPSSPSKNEKTNESLKIDSDNNTVSSNQIIYRIQVASSVAKITSNAPELKGLKNVKEIKLNNSYKYYFGEYAKFEEAIDMQAKIRYKGFKDAFVVAFNNGKIISVAEAKKLNSNQVN